MDAVWISQRWECVQQDAGRSHEGGGPRLLDVIPRQHPDLHWRTLGQFWSFDTGCLGTYGSWNQDTTLKNQAVPVRGGIPGVQD